jgi:DNA-binding NarL/FixJ family response regulator
VAHLRVLVVDDYVSVRAGVVALLETEPNFSVVAEAETGSEAIEKAREHQPDVILMDIQLIGSLSGIEACEHILEHQPSIKIIMLTAFDDEKLATAATKAGAIGYLLKRFGNRELLDVLKAIAFDDATVDLTLTRAILEETRNAAGFEDSSAFSELTPQEMKILALIASGCTNREIARQICLAENTIRNYITEILRKLKVSNRVEAAVFAVRHHIERHLPPDENE